MFVKCFDTRESESTSSLVELARKMEIRRKQSKSSPSRLLPPSFHCLIYQYFAGEEPLKHLPFPNWLASGLDCLNDIRKRCDSVLKEVAVWEDIRCGSCPSKSPSQKSYPTTMRCFKLGSFIFHRGQESPKIPRNTSIGS